ncbi:hypothetical protein EV421DRAFT_1720396, partial [Armillaria borealis]
GYVDSTIPCPPIVSTMTGASTTIPDPTPMWSTTPSRDEWKYCDTHVRSHIILNVLDPIGLGVKTTGSAKETWDSIMDTYGIQNEMALSEAKGMLEKTEYVDGADVDAHIQDLWTKRRAVDDLSDPTKVMTDQEFQGIIIRSIPHVPNWIPLIPTLYQCKLSIEVILLLQTHHLTLYKGKKPDTSLALNASVRPSPTGKWCRNPECKACKKSTHNIEDCYWPGEGKEGQFPENFGRN